MYVPATDQFWKSSRVEKNAFFDFSQFDVVLINYSVRTSVTGHLDDSILKCLVEYQGIKILFADEYEGIENPQIYGPYWFRHRVYVRANFWCS